jgi:phosphoglycolate phosphatase-like HAD superfamily hydrolase
MDKYSKDVLENFKPTKKYFAGIDSDGCVFDTMGIKQRECFCPWMIGYFGLQPVAQAARECKDFADLFSKTRGGNRHKTLKRILFELLPLHPMVKARNFKVPQYPHYFAWVDDPGSLLSNEGLKRAAASASNPDAKRELELAFQWSEKVNWSVKEIVKGIPPFPWVEESLKKLREVADVVVVSATPCEALQREWVEHDIAKYAAVIAGQEMGTKKEHLELASGGKYEPGHVLMVGDAPGDFKAAKANKALFFPVNPGQEEKSWELFYKEGIEKFISGKYSGDYENKLVKKFEELLPAVPPWK